MLKVERRREPRLQTDEPMRVTTLNSSGNARGHATMLDISENGLLMKYWGALEVGAMLRLETSDLLMLGEVVRIARDGEAWRVGVTIRHSLQDLPALARTYEGLLART